MFCDFTSYCSMPNTFGDILYLEFSKVCFQDGIITRCLMGADGTIATSKRSKSLFCFHRKFSIIMVPIQLFPL